MKTLHLRHRILFVIGLAISLSGCGTFPKVLETANATVPAVVVIPAANAFTILKAGASRYGQYCINERMVPSICSADIRRSVIKAVRVGTGARNRMSDSIENGTPAAASVYNLMIGAIDDLKKSPTNSVQFAGAVQ